MKKFYDIVSNLGGDVFGPVPIPRVDADQGVIASVISYAFIIIGIVSVIMIIIASLQYIASLGDPQKTKKAKDTILYAVIGLAVSISAWAIIGFILGRI